jgi:uncharacterized protein (DUF885 family)
MVGNGTAAEIGFYIIFPGQAVSYKTGDIKNQ